MRISRSKQPRAGISQGGKTSRYAALHPSSFSAELEHAQPERPSFEAMLERIEECARELVRQPSAQNFVEYKRAVRSFLTAVVNASYVVAEQACFDRFGQRKLYLLVQRIDTSLEALGQAFISRSQKTLDLAGRLDEIRGWLLDLYS